MCLPSDLLFNSNDKTRTTGKVYQSLKASDGKPYIAFIPWKIYLHAYPPPNSFNPAPVSPRLEDIF